MTAPLSEPTESKQLWQNSFKIKDTRQKPLAMRWWQPDCSYGDMGDCEECTPDCVGDEPALENGWAQPAQSTDLEKFAFRLHADGSLEFKGHLDAAGASSGTVAFTLPGAIVGDKEFLLPRDQFFLTVIYDGADPQSAMVYISASTGEVTITYPV